MVEKKKVAVHTLGLYIVNKTQTRYFSPMDGVVGGLEAKMILYKSSTLGRGHKFAYNIQPWAYHRIEAKPNIILVKVQQLVEDNK